MDCLIPVQLVMGNIYFCVVQNLNITFLYILFILSKNSFMLSELTELCRFFPVCSMAVLNIDSSTGFNIDNAFLIFNNQCKEKMSISTGLNSMERKKN